MVAISFALGGVVQAGVRAIIVLDNGQTYEDMSLERIDSDLVTLMDNVRGYELSFPPDSIEEVVFRIPVNVTDLEGMYTDGKYEDLIQKVEPLIEPLTPYLSLPNNVQPLVVNLLKAHYWLQHNEKVKMYADLLLTMTDVDSSHSLASSYRALAALEERDLERTQKILEEKGVSIDKMYDEPIHSYILAKWYRQQGQLLEAQEVIARIIAFHGDDYEWMPSALHMSADLYSRADHFLAGLKVVEEFNFFYSNSHIHDEMKQLEEKLREREEKAIEEVLQIENQE